MSRFKIPSREDANVDTHSTLDAVGKRLGFIPNLHRLMSISPNAFAGWAALQDALKQTLDARTREGMAMAVSEVNGCDYCIAAHSYVATTLVPTARDLYFLQVRESHLRWDAVSSKPVSSVIQASRDAQRQDFRFLHPR
jgi:AhpD family alkylhydroperoxidase